MLKSLQRKPKRVLFFPWGIGGGAAYTGHCVVLAEEFKRRGFEVAFSDGGISRMISEAGFTVLKQEIENSHAPENIPPYLPFTSVERVYSAGARFYRFSKLKNQYDEDARIMDEWQPNLVVVDMVATASLAARVRSIPVISVAEADFLSLQPNAWMPWFDGDPKALFPYPNCLPTFQRLSEEVKGPKISSISDLLWGDVTIVPSIAELDPVHTLEGARGHIFYRGPLYWNPVQKENLILQEPGTSSEKKKIYLTLGSGGMGSQEDLQTIVDSMVDPEWSCFASLGLHEKHLKIPSSVKSGGFTGLDLPLRWADVVVTHGGSATVLASLCHTKPMIVVPFMSECEMNGRQYVEGTGSGILARTSYWNASSSKLRFKNWDSSGLAPVDSADSAKISKESIQAAIRQVLGQHKYLEQVRKVGQKLNQARTEFDLNQVLTKVF